MEKTLAVLNELASARVLQQYAIGGATGLLFHTEPTLTYDLDVFCLFATPPTAVLSLTPVYDFLRRRGYAADGEHVVIEGIPVQLLPAHNELLIEAVEQAEEHRVHGVPTRVFRYEHLLAVMVQTGRAKDRARLLQALEARPADEQLLGELLARHALAARFRQWRGES